MTLWDFVILGPKDLGPFSDLLEDHGHPGCGLVRDLIRDRKFPRKVGPTYQWMTYSADEQVRAEAAWEMGWGVWGCIKKRCAIVGLFPGPTKGRNFSTLTQAIWAVANTALK